MIVTLVTVSCAMFTIVSTGHCRISNKTTKIKIDCVNHAGTTAK